MGACLSVLDHETGENGRRVERAIAMYATYRMLKSLYCMGASGVVKSLTSVALAGGNYLPGVSGLIKAELDKEMEKIEQQVLGDGDADALINFPPNGIPAEEILKKADDLVSGKHGGFASGKKWGGIYYRNTQLSELQAAIWKKFSTTNSLYPMVFPVVRKFEAELVTMVTNMVHGKVGLLTSGGTESIVIAMLAYREQGYKNGIAVPEIVCGVTAHPAVAKAAHYLRMKLVKVKVDPKTQKMTTALTSPAITRNTVCVFASAPTFSHGVVDPIVELAKLTKSKNVGLHVDNCLGGFLLSYLKKEGIYKEEFDFNVDGVTTMSVDVHKYGFASKGASCTIFRDPELRQLTYVTSTDGCEGLYVTPTIQGSRSGAVIAAAWSTVTFLGDSGYAKAARRLHSISEGYIKELEKYPELELLTHSDCAVIPIKSTSPDVNIYLLASILEKKGWNMFTGQNPPVMSVCVGEQHSEEVIKEWSSDVKDALAMIKDNPGMKVEGAAAVYGVASTTPDELLKTIMCQFVDTTLTVKQKSA
eukprot:TRINITY_DN4553_c1_g1_i3.p1 TRINITY_DN4553_c1_g1~~TRINITY_DN4553_c1_g1_i3.p1  ORF type:complete len:547 (+),score=142.66 TRINITY_DN4553_c1_g1_i3:48-1643(+)